MVEKKKADKVTEKILEGLREKILKDMIDAHVVSEKKDSMSLQDYPKVVEYLINQLAEKRMKLGIATKSRPDKW